MPTNNTSPALSLPFIQPAQAQKHVTHNEALDLLDALVQTTVLRADLSDAPVTPQEGDMYLVAAPGSGEWAGQADAIARHSDGNWRFFTPQEGWRIWVVDTGEMLVHAQTGWQVIGTLGGATSDLLGINATADSFNRLTVNAPATLLSHEGSNHRLKINKAAATDTASLLFQDGFSGRAEMGLAGSDDWSIRVSDDGATWITALEVDATTGLVSGAGVQASNSDVTEGRLVTTEGAGAAALGHFGSYYNASAQRDIDTLAAGDIGLYSTANPGSWPASAPTFVLLETQRVFSNDSVRQIATAYPGSTSLSSPPRQWIRLRSGNGDWSAWAEVFTQASAVGAVSHSGGMPTGALIEQGGNANGEYIRFADGTQICWAYGLAEFGTASALVSTITFPAAFVARPAVQLTPMHASDGAAPAGGNWIGGFPINMLTRTTSATAMTVHAIRDGAWVSGYALPFHATATGRWF